MAIPLPQRRKPPRFSFQHLREADHFLFQALPFHPCQDRAGIAEAAQGGQGAGGQEFSVFGACVQERKQPVQVLYARGILGRRGGLLASPERLVMGPPDPQAQIVV